MSSFHVRDMIHSGRDHIHIWNNSFVNESSHIQHSVTSRIRMSKVTWGLSPLCSFIQGRRNTLQHTATHCNTLQHTATHTQHMATYYNTLQHTRFHIAVILSQLLCAVAGIYLQHILWCFLFHMCDMTHSQRRDTPLHSNVRHEDMHSFIHTCDMNCVANKACTHSYVWHGTHSFMCVTWHMHSKEKHTHIWHEHKNYSLTLLFASGA